MPPGPKQDVKKVMSINTILNETDDDDDDNKDKRTSAKNASPSKNKPAGPATAAGTGTKTGTVTTSPEWKEKYQLKGSVQLPDPLEFFQDPEQIRYEEALLKILGDLELPAF
jgi:hypothetical protein